MKIYFLYFFLLISSVLFSQDFTIETKVYKPGDNYYGQIEKIDFYYTKENVCIKRHFFFTKEYENNNGPIEQIEYFENGISVKFEMNYGESFIHRTDIINRIDYVDANDNITKIEITTKDLFKWSFENDGIKRFNNYIPKPLKYAFDLYTEDGIPQDNAIISEAPIFKFSSSIPINNEVTNLSNIEKAVIYQWCSSHGADDLAPYYEKKVEYLIDNIKVIVCFQNSHYNFVSNYDQIYASYYYIGGINNSMIVIVTSYYGHIKVNFV